MANKAGCTISDAKGYGFSNLVTAGVVLGLEMYALLRFTISIQSLAETSLCRLTPPCIARM